MINTLLNMQTDKNNIAALRFVSAGTSTLSGTITGSLTLAFEVSNDGLRWRNWNGTASIKFSDTLYVRGKNTGLSQSSSRYYKFNMSGSNIECYGNISYLVDPFYEGTSSYCYYRLFYNCKILTKAPELPAKTLATYCYNSMFRECTALEAAPKLPAEIMVTGCYYFMFYGCSSLKTASELPAKTLASNCYQYMFQNCTSLKNAPELPAKTLASNCYQYMFQGCTNLKQITCLYTGSNLFNYTTNWVNNVPAGGVFYASKDKQWTEKYGVSNIPTGWTIEYV